MSKEKINIRTMAETDLPVVLELCQQLGYATDLFSLKNRFAKLTSHQEHDLFVACSTENAVLGWMHVREMHSLERSFVIEVAAIVIDENCRGQGIGKKLMAVAERWGAERGFSSVILRSRETRTDAHRFYEGLGYTKAKKSFGFIKELDGRSIGNEV